MGKCMFVFNYSQSLTVQFFYFSLFSWKEKQNIQKRKITIIIKMETERIVIVTLTNHRNRSLLYVTNKLEQLNVLEKEVCK